MLYVRVEKYLVRYGVVLKDEFGFMSFLGIKDGIGLYTVF